MLRLGQVKIFELFISFHYNRLQPARNVQRSLSITDVSRVKRLSWKDQNLVTAQKTHSSSPDPMYVYEKQWLQSNRDTNESTYVHYYNV